MKVKVPLKKSQSAESFITYAARMHNPSVVASHNKRMKSQIAIIGAALFKTQQDPKVLTRYTRECFAWAYYQGLRRGYSLGQTIASRDKKEVSGDKKEASGDKKDIPLQMLVKNPQQTARRLCERLDEARVCLPSEKRWEKKIKKDVLFARESEFWISALDCAATKSAVEVYISLLRKKARQLRLASQWRTVLKWEKKLKKAA